jgi:hypothetical protein
VLTNVVLQNIAISALMFMSLRAGLPGQPPLAVAFVGMAALSLTMLGAHLAGIGRKA